MALTKLTKDKFIPFLDIEKDITLASCNYKRIDLSTIFELAINEETEELDYICYANKQTEVKSNNPELPQEIAVYEGNPIYDFIIKEIINLPTGNDCKVPILLCFGGTDKSAWRNVATIINKTLNTVDGKASFTIKFGGDIEIGHYSIDATGVPTFNPITTNDGEAVVAKTAKEAKDITDGKKDK